MNNIHGTPNRGGGGSDRREITLLYDLIVLCGTVLGISVVGGSLGALTLWLIIR